MRVHALGCAILALGLAASSCAAAPSGGGAGGKASGSTPAASSLPVAAAAPAGTEVALFAGGCFWSLQSAFEKVYGVVSAVSGYAGGRNADPSYEDYAENGHVEVVRVTYDPARIDYAALLDAYWHHSDPTDPSGAFVDRGPQYRPIVYWYSAGQRDIATASKAALDRSGVFRKPVVAELLPAPAFWPAEDYHQDYPLKNPAQYEYYRSHSGRDEFFSSVWGAAALTDPGAPKALKNGRYSPPGQAELAKLLSPMQFEVTQRDGTEPPYDNAYWDNHAAGIYVDVVSGEVLFSSRDKYDSGTGWPSFTRPLDPANIVLRQDTSLGMVRVEVRSRYADSHLGHLFDDGPQPTGLRYCMDSAALRFVPLADMAKEGYGDFIKYLK